MTQRVATDPEGRKVVLGVTLDMPADATKPRISFRLTPTAYREAGAAIKIDDRQPIRTPITACDANVCEVQAWLDADVVGWMKAGRLMQFAYFLDRERQATFPVSLQGFEAALAALREKH